MKGLRIKYFHAPWVLISSISLRGDFNESKIARLSSRSIILNANREMKNTLSNKAVNGADKDKVFNIEQYWIAIM